MINKIHECLLRLILDDKTNSFADVLTKIKTIKTKINHKPSAEFSSLNDALFKPMSNLASLKIENVFIPRVNNYNLKNLQQRETEAQIAGGRVAGLLSWVAFLI